MTASGDILFTDTGNDRVRMLTLGEIAAPISEEARLVSMVNAASLVDGPVRQANWYGSRRQGSARTRC